MEAVIQLLGDCAMEERPHFPSPEHHQHHHHHQVLYTSLGHLKRFRPAMDWPINVIPSYKTTAGHYFVKNNFLICILLHSEWIVDATQQRLNYNRRHKSFILLALFLPKCITSPAHVHKHIEPQRMNHIMSGFVVDSDRNSYGICPVVYVPVESHGYTIERLNGGYFKWVLLPYPQPFTSTLLISGLSTGNRFILV